MLVGEYVCVLIICLGDAVASIYLRHPPLSIHSGSINLCSSASLVTRPGFSFKVPRSLSTIIVSPPVTRLLGHYSIRRVSALKFLILGSMQETYFLIVSKFGFVCTLSFARYRMCRIILSTEIPFSMWTYQRLQLIYITRFLKLQHFTNSIVILAVVCCWWLMPYW